MTKKLSVAQAKARLSEVLSRVEDRGERYVIERRGKPVAAVVPLGDLPLADRPAAGDWLTFILNLGPEGREWGEALDEIVLERASRAPRPVKLEDD